MSQMEPNKQQEILAKHKEYLFSCVANYYEEPLVVDRAKDSLIYDVEGREYLDFFGGIVTISVGHCNDKVVAAIQETDPQGSAHLHPLPQRAARPPGREARGHHPRGR